MNRALLRRFFAFAVDWNIMFGGALVLMLYGPGANPEYFLYPSIRMLSSGGFLLGFTWLFLYGLFKDCIFGRRSLGKLIFGLEIVDADQRGAVSYCNLILRNIPYCIVQIEGIMVLANHGRRLGDLLANTLVTHRS